MQIITADTEIERPAEIGCKAKFLTELPGMFVVQILRDEPVAAAQLRIAIRANSLTGACPGAARLASKRRK